MRNSPIETFKRGQMVKVLGVNTIGETTHEDAKILRPMPIPAETYTYNGEVRIRPALDGWYVVRFADGARLGCHAERMIAA